MSEESHMALDSAEINGKIAAFQKDLALLSSKDIVRKHVISGSCHILSDDDYLHLRTRVADKYGLHTNDVLVVGSCKLGFSIAPYKRYQHFGDSSDIDVAVVSQALFDHLWEKVHYYAEHGGYWERSLDFKDYLFNGWIRPDKLPPSHSFELAKEWWEFFNELSRSGNYSSVKVRGAIYRNWYFLESYQLRSVSACQDELNEVQA